MPHKHSSQNSTQNRAGASRLSATDLKPNKTSFAPQPDEVAYFSYEIQGLQHGQDMQHWLAAETELFSERNLR